MTESAMPETTTNPIRRTRGGLRKECERCGRDFRVPPSASYAKFCSRACQYVRVTKTCEQCGKEFQVIPAVAERTRFCSWACHSKKIVKTCERCGATFEVKRSGAKTRFCSRDCKNKPLTRETPDGTEKWCGQGQHFALLSEFYRAPERKSGLQSTCRGCKRRLAGLEHHKLTKHRRYIDKRDQALDYAKRWRESNREKMAEYKRRSVERNGEHYKEYKKRWGKDNVERVRLNHVRRRVRQLDAPGSHTEAEWLAKFAFHGGRCFYCKVELNSKTRTRDHRRPLTRGGADWVANIVPACRSCNSKKHDKTEAEFRGLTTPPPLS